MRVVPPQAADNDAVEHELDDDRADEEERDVRQAIGDAVNVHVVRDVTQHYVICRRIHCCRRQSRILNKDQSENSLTV